MIRWMRTLTWLDWIILLFGLGVLGWLVTPSVARGEEPHVHYLMLIEGSGGMVRVLAYENKEQCEAVDAKVRQDPSIRYTSGCVEAKMIPLRPDEDDDKENKT